MSRWIENFESSNFHKQWSDFKTKIDNFDLKTVSDSEIIDEYSRLRKMIIFVDSYLKLVDPELSSDNSLNSSDQYIKEANQHFDLFNNNNKDIHYIKNVNNYMDQFVSSIKNLNLSMPKISSRSVSKMIQEYSNVISKALADINLEKIKSDTKKIYELKDKLIDNEDNIEDRIDNLFEDIQEKYTKITEFHDEVLVDEDTYTSTKTEILDAKKEILDEIRLVKNNLTESSKKLDELDKFYIKIFGNFDEAQEKRLGGLEQELKNRKNELEEFKEAQKNELYKIKEEHETKYNAFVNEIEGLLSGATSVGLAKAYEDERIKFKTPIKVWNAVFILCLVAISSLSFYTLKDLNSIQDITKSIFHSLPITLPLIWIAVYASKRRSENQRLDQEYAHKEALARSYISYKKQIDNLDIKDSELLVKLITEAINAISYNASKTLDKKHGDGTILNEILQSVKNLKQSDTK